MDIKLRDEALIWIREVAEIVANGTRQIDPESAEEIERETARYLDEMKKLSTHAVYHSASLVSRRSDSAERRS